MHFYKKKGFWGSVEILERNRKSLLEALFYIVLLAPAARASPDIVIIIRRLMKNPDKRGGRGMLPLGCLPLWEREGVTLLAAAENKRITGKRGFQQSRFLRSD